jgi:lysozyme family protein
MSQLIDPFKIALQFTLKWEGGMGHPADLAGTVNRGISQDTYDTYCDQKDLGKRPVSQITDAELEDIYREMYWKASHADQMCLPLAVVHFDTAVNFSVTGSISFLQETLGLSNPDGILGPKTAAALAKNNTLQTATRYCQSRMNYRQERVKKNPNQEIFLQGWLRRDRDLLNYITQLATSETSPKNNPGKPNAPVVTSDATPTPEKLTVENRDQIAEKLEQAINLLQEVVTLFKQQK